MEGAFNAENEIGAADMETAALLTKDSRSEPLGDAASFKYGA
jgi:hypothetical protein